MRRRDPQHGSRLPAFPGGFVAVLALVLLPLVVPANAADTPGDHERQPAPSVCDAPPSPPEQALHRVAATATGGAVHTVHPCGSSPVPALIPAAQSDARPADPSGVAAVASGIPLRVLFCTWLN